MKQPVPVRQAARAIAIAPPLRLRAPRTLEETLVAVGIVPRSHGRRTHGLLWRWFAAESTPLAFANAVAAVALFLIALTMTATGMALAVALHAAATIYAVLNNGLPYAGIALIIAALLKATHSYFAYRATRWSRLVGFVLAGVLFASGVWLEAMFGYADFVPWLFKPILALAGGAATVRIATFNATLYSYFEPVMAGGLALLLVAKLSKTALVRYTTIARRRLALGGIGAGLCVLLVAGHAGYRHYTGADRRDGFGFAIGGDAVPPGSVTYGSLFAPGVQCHLSSLYGWRSDPIDKTRIENHQGVDLAVKAGTAVHAMADGRVMFAEFDQGLGNFVALQADGKGAPVIVNGHMSQLAVRAGDVIHRGDVIGFAGSTGRSTGPHVHLQLCPSGHMHRGGFVCGGSTNPYENWPTLAALSHMSCLDGPEIF